MPIWLRRQPQGRDLAVRSSGEQVMATLKMVICMTIWLPRGYPDLLHFYAFYPSFLTLSSVAITL